MLLMKIVTDRVAACPAASPIARSGPPPPPASEPGTTPDAAPGSCSAHTQASAAEPTSSAHESATIVPRERTALQYPVRKYRLADPERDCET